MGRMANVWGAEGFLRDTPDGDHLSSARELADEGQPCFDLYTRRVPVRASRAGMRGNDVPEQDVVRELELGQDTVDDGRRRLGRACAGELALRGKRDARDARSAIAGCLADEQDRRGGT